MAACLERGSSTLYAMVPQQYRFSQHQPHHQSSSSSSSSQTPPPPRPQHPAGPPQNHRQGHPPGMFPAPAGGGAAGYYRGAAWSGACAACRDQDTGGFFIALIQGRPLTAS